MKTKIGHFVLTILWLAAVLLGTSLGTREIAVAENTSAPQKTERPAEGDTEKNPLLPADTSSPRDTVEGFLRDMTIVIEDYRKSGSLSSAEGWRAYYRALSMLDFSATPDGNSWLVMDRRILMLKEILDRIALPPETEIPGDDEVARENLTQWTIPGTNITIQRAEKGAKTGKFLFSAGTVQRLHRFYGTVKHLPYKPESTPGFYEAFTRSERSSPGSESAMRNRLRPVNTTSPRSTLEGFLDNINHAYTLVMEANAALKASPPTITMDEAREMEQRADNLMGHATGTLDLSKVPKAIREDVGIESALQLKEILDRLDLPPTDVIPDAEMVKAEREHLGGTASGEGKPFRWQIPNTTIEIVEIMEGENQGKFLFSADTVSNLDHLYQKIRDFPYRRDFTHLETGYMGLEKKTEGFYDYYISTPGYLISRISPLDQWVKRLPDWFKKVYGGQTLWQWMTLVLALCLGALFLVMLHWVILRRLSPLSPAGRHWRRVIFNLIAMGVLYWLSGILDDIVNLTGYVLHAVLTGLETIYWFFLATGVFFFSQALSESIVASPKIDPDGAKASIYRAIFGVVGFLAMAVLMITGLHEVGVSLVPLLASVGLGGFAIALAARPTLENVIGSFMIFLDKPYRVGQRVNILGHNGTIESIGLRSTKIRLLTGHQTSIPNEKMASVEIENIGRRPFIRRRFNVTITYDTPPEKIIRAEEILKEILAVPEASDAKAETAIPEAKTEQKPHPNDAINRPDYPPRVYFNDLNADSLNILVFYWYHPAQYWDYLEHARWINIQIMERFNAEGIDFAFPTQTLHLAGDDKRPLTVGQRWVSKEEAFSPSAVFAQAADLGAQAAQSSGTPVSDSLRTEIDEDELSRPKAEGDLTVAPIEDDALFGNDGNEADGEGSAR